MKRYWLFDEDMLDRAVTTWLDGEDVVRACAKETLVRDFLESAAARSHKLVVNGTVASRDRTPKP